jgi:uncharacterized membrane protein
MAIQQYRTLFILVTVVAALFVASPAIQQVLVVSQKESLTEFSLLGPYHNATYPYNITSGTEYRLYFDVVNRLGSCAYYQVDVKFRNQAQSAPNSFNHTSSNQSSLGEISFFAANKQTIELPIDISFQYNEDPYYTKQLNMQSVTVNGATLNANVPIAWDPEKGAFLGNVFFELWVFNDTSNTFQYHERYLSLWLNLTRN